MEKPKILGASDVLQHNTRSDCWIIVNEEVWDMTEFALQHPGGAEGL